MGKKIILINKFSFYLKNGIGKRVGNEFFIRLNRLGNAFTNQFPNAFDHGFLDVLNDFLRRF